MRRVSLELRLLGRFAVLRDGVEIAAADFGGRKVRALLRILATRRGTFVSHDLLTEMLWPDRRPADPVANLQVLVNRARRVLGDPGVVRTGPGGYALADGDSLTVDAERFLAAVERARRQQDAQQAHAGYRTALAEWRGDPLAEDTYDDWAADYRQHLHRVRLSALDGAARAAAELGEYDEAAQLAATAVEAEPLRESSLLLLVRALAAAGDPVAALDGFDTYRQRLADELGLDPSAEAAAVQQQLLAGASRPTRSRSSARAPADFTELPFVGREDVVRQVLDAVTGPSGATVVLEGVSGVGKSRLLSVLARRTPTLVVRAYLAERTEPWSLARTLLRELLAVDATFADRLPTPLRGAMATVLPELEPAPGPVDPESRRALVREAALRLLDAAGAVVAVDDLQWADPSSLAMLEAGRARLAALRLVLAVRPEELADADAVRELLGRLPVNLRLRLREFDAQQIGALVDDRGLAVTLAADTDGTPLAVGEVLRALAAEGLVVRPGGERWEPIDPSVVARAGELGRAGKERAIGRRADAQPAEVRTLLECLALLGRETPSSVVAEAAGADETGVLDGLTRLAHDGLVRPGDLGWATAHDMVTEALVSRMPAEHRAALHGRLAAALERVHADAAEVARHWRGAGDGGRAATAYAAAAVRALESFAHEEAIGLVDEGLALATDSSLEARLREVRGGARARIGDIPGAREDLRVALGAQPTGPDRARLLGALAMVASGADDLVRAAELAELAIVEAGADPSAEAQALEVASVLDMNLARPERSAARSAEALARYRGLGDARGVARVLDARAMARFLGGDIRGGIEELRRSGDRFEDSGELLRVVTPRSTSGHALVFAGRPVEGLALSLAALELARQLGYPEGEAYALWHCAEAAAASGRSEESSSYAKEALATATRIGHRGWTATGWRAVGIAAEAGGDLGAALAAYRSSLALSEHLDLFASWAASRIASVLARQGELDAAEPMVSRALSTGPPLAHYEARLAEVELARARGSSSAVTLAREALSKARAGGWQQGVERLEEQAG